MQIAIFNTQPIEEVKKQLFQCCGSSHWVESMAKHFPFASEKSLVKNAETAWYDTCGEADWLDAFTQHPKIGDLESLTKKFAATQHLAGSEQSDVQNASRAVLERLAAANAEYESKFGFIFIVCATGKSAGEMLRLLEDRLKNSRQEELQIAMGEQHKITIIRLTKLFTEANWSTLRRSQITSHILDTSIGIPAQDITIKLQRKGTHNQWLTFCQGVTNKDGRVGDLLPQERILMPDTYQMVFETGAYFVVNNMKVFYPEVEIQFRIADDQHYHIPLLLNPFGYSTYRGS